MGCTTAVLVRKLRHGFLPCKRWFSSLTMWVFWDLGSDHCNSMSAICPPIANHLQPTSFRCQAEEAVAAELDAVIEEINQTIDDIEPSNQAWKDAKKSHKVSIYALRSDKPMPAHPMSAQYQPVLKYWDHCRNALQLYPKGACMSNRSDMFAQWDYWSDWGTRVLKQGGVEWARGLVSKISNEAV